MAFEISIVNASLMVGTSENGFTKAMRNTFTGGYWQINPSHPNFNSELLRLVLQNKPTIVFLQLQAEGLINLDIVREIAKHSFIIHWCGDKREESPPKWYLTLGRLVHLTLFSNMEDVRGCRNHGVMSDWLECGVDHEIYYPRPHVIQDYDVVAHLNYYTNFPLSDYRFRAVKRLKEEFGSKFDVFGQFPGAKSDFNADQNAEAVNYCHAKIAISISNFCVSQYASDRLNRIIATGTPLCLSHHFPMVSEMYYPGRHIVTFDDLDDMIFKCRYFLNHEEERLRIVRNGHKHFLENYTFSKMAENLKNYYLTHK